jgi:uncharacterized protein
VRTLLALALVLAALVGGCGDGDEPTAGPATTGAPTTTGSGSNGSGLARGRVEIETSGGRRSLTVEIAETPEQQQRGLMFRESLPRDAGMIFAFPDERTGGFWMKDTLIPLSIAFYDGEGVIVAILDMEPCREDPCPVYAPDAAYRGALEVNQGVFDELGVAVGDRIRLVR